MQDFDTDNIIPIELKLLESQVDLLLRSLELYSFNLHHTWSVKVDDDLAELRNALIFYTYNSLLEQKRTNNYKIGYDIVKEHKLTVNSKKIKEFRKYKNKIA